MENSLYICERTKAAYVRRKLKPATSCMIYVHYAHNERVCTC